MTALPNTESGVGTCTSCGEEYGLGCSVGASDRPGVCASCAEELDDSAARAVEAYYADIRAEAGREQRLRDYRAGPREEK